MCYMCAVKHLTCKIDYLHISKSSCITQEDGNLLLVHMQQSQLAIMLLHNI